MSCVQKIMEPVEMNIDSEKYYYFIKNNVYHIPNITSTIQDVAVHEGDWDNSSHDCIKVWNYTIDGKAEVLKEQPEFDDETLKISFIAVKGDLLKKYKRFKIIPEIVPKGPQQCVVYITIEYEKYDPTTPDPYNYLQLIAKFIKDAEAYLIHN
ncbi:MLP-like protein 329 [Cucumis melo]|uniref:MLP-like protein 329 n=1 Tax=Cucumis melo TaxID=3656 RepID=A0A1S3BNT9_CUCME|nr:MLP-like protein 329 [Cucumis melo]